MLLTVGELKKVEGRLKLFKLQHLLQMEAKLKFDKRDEETDMGYTAYGTLDNCMQQDLLKQTEVPIGIGLPRCDYELTPSGEQLYAIFKKRLGVKEMEKITSVLTKFRDMSGADLIMYTHKKYIDDYPLTSVPTMAAAQAQAIIGMQKIMHQIVQESQDPEVYVMEGKLEHVKRILKALPAKAQNRVQSGIILCSIKELEENLTSSAYRPNDAAEDLFEFIENYAEKENILPSVASEDLSKLPEEENKCLSKFLNQVKNQLSS